eukprot:sb/3478073/
MSFLSSYNVQIDPIRTWNHVYSADTSQNLSQYFAKYLQKNQAPTLAEYLQFCRYLQNRRRPVCQLQAQGGATTLIWGYTLKGHQFHTTSEQRENDIAPDLKKT